MRATMIKSALLVYLVFISFNLWSQKKYAISATGGLDYSYRTISGDSRIRAAIQPADKGGTGFRAGIDGSLFLNQHISIKAGIRYLSTGYGTKENMRLQMDTNYLISQGYFFPDTIGPNNIQFRYRYSYIEIPVGVSYQWGQKKLSWFAGAGVTANIYLSSSTTSITDIGKHSVKDQAEYYNRFGLGVYLSAGAQYKLNPHFQVFAQPTIRYNITSLNNNAPLKYHLFSLGSEFGLRYILTRKCISPPVIKE